MNTKILDNIFFNSYLKITVVWTLHTLTNSWHLLLGYIVSGSNASKIEMFYAVFIVMLVVVCFSRYFKQDYNAPVN